MMEPETLMVFFDQISMKKYENVVRWYVDAKGHLIIYAPNEANCIGVIWAPCTWKRVEVLRENR